jgi:hypothetical protein
MGLSQSIVVGLRRESEIGMIRVMTGKKVLLRIGAALAVVLAIAWVEPWAERFEGKTVEGWLKVFREKNEIDHRVVEAFGGRAAPKLAAVIKGEVRAGKIRHLSAELLEMVVSGNAEIDGTDSHQLAVAAGSWLSWLAAKGHAPEMDFEPEVDHWLDVHDDSFWAPRWVQLVLTTPDESKAAREAAGAGTR